jgi:hypothetical protein
MLVRHGFSWDRSTLHRPQGPGRFTVPQSFAIRHMTSTAHQRAGILTGCPSTTLFSLVLGPA